MSKNNPKARLLEAVKAADPHAQIETDAELIHEAAETIERLMWSLKLAKNAISSGMAVEKARRDLGEAG